MEERRIPRRTIIIIVVVSIVLGLIFFLPTVNPPAGSVSAELIKNKNDYGVLVRAAVTSPGQFRIIVESSVDRREKVLYMEAMKRYEEFIPVKFESGDTITVVLENANTGVTLDTTYITAPLVDSIKYGFAGDSKYYIMYSEDGIGISYYVKIVSPTYKKLLSLTLVTRTPARIVPVTGDIEKPFSPGPKFAYRNLYVFSEYMPGNYMDYLKKVRSGDAMLLVMPKFMYYVSTGDTIELNPNAEKIINRDAIIYYIMSLATGRIKIAGITYTFKYFTVQYESFPATEIAPGVYRIRYGSGYIYWIPTDPGKIDIRIAIMFVYLDYVERLGGRVTERIVWLDHTVNNVLVSTSYLDSDTVYSMLVLIPLVKNNMDFTESFLYETGYITVKT